MTDIRDLNPVNPAPQAKPVSSKKPKAGWVRQTGKKRSRRDDGPKSHIDDYA